MYCIKCGAPVSEGEQFCSACGEKVEPAGAQQPAVQQPSAEPMVQPAYGTYGHPMQGKKKSPLLWVLIGVAAVLAIAAVIIFVVLPGGQSAFGPLRGDTTQTKFVNDGAAFFADAFQGLGSDTFSRMAKEPFDLDYDMTVEAEGQNLPMSINAAYDEKTLGFSADTMGVKIIMLLEGDTMYQSMGGLFGGSVNGIRFKTDADLSKPMPLQERIAALTEGISTGGALTQEDMMKLAEMFVNSIDEKCFKKTGDEWTLTMNEADVKNLLSTFKEKLSGDKELLSALESQINQSSAEDVDLIKQIDEAIASLETSGLKFSLAASISYKGGKPAGLSLSLDDGTTKADVSFKSEKTAQGAKIDFDVAANDAKVADGSISYEKKADGVEFGVTINAENQTISLNGSEKQDKDRTTGEITINVPQTEEIIIEYEGTLKFGKPEKDVAEDDRFEVDTENATVTDFSSGTGSSIPGLDSFGVPAF